MESLTPEGWEEEGGSKSTSSRPTHSRRGRGGFFILFPFLLLLQLWGWAGTLDGGREEGRDPKRAYQLQKRGGFGGGWRAKKPFFLAQRGRQRDGGGGGGGGERKEILLGAHSVLNPLPPSWLGVGGFANGMQEIARKT